MATEKDLKFVEYIYNNTIGGKLQWESTAEEEKFVVSIKGKYKVTIDRNREPDDDQLCYWLTLFDDSDRELLVIYGHESRRVRELFDLARRNSLNVDSVIDDILAESPENAAKKNGTIDDEDIPFS